MGVLAGVSSPRTASEAGAQSAGPKKHACKLEATVGTGPHAAAKRRKSCRGDMSGTGGRWQGRGPPPSQACSPLGAIRSGHTGPAVLPGWNQKPRAGHHSLYAGHARGQEPKSLQTTSQAQTRAGQPGPYVTPGVPVPHRPCVPPSSPPIPAACPPGPHHSLTLPAWPWR